MEKAILKTLIYADLFDYPLKAYEIHKWLISKKTSLRQVEKGLQRLSKKNKVSDKNGYYFLPNRSTVVGKRIKREKQSRRFFWKTKYVVWFLKLIPWIKLVGVSGGLAMDNADKSDDIDLFIVVSRNRLWISRLFITFFLNSMGVRRSVNMKINQISGKLCTNILVEVDRLEQDKKDLYVAHEVLQMKVLWQREGVYSKYLVDNEWVFKFLPNWITSERLMIKDLRLKKKNHQSSIINHKSLLNYIENLARWFQMKIMVKPQGMERIEDRALYFHPNDVRSKILQEYKKRIKNI